MRELKVFPLLWKDEKEEAFPEVHRLARIFAEENLKNPPKDFRHYWRTWVLVETEADALIEAKGVMSLRQEIDVPLFHMKAPAENSRAAVVEFAKGYDLLAQRGRIYLTDNGFGGNSIFVHVSEQSENATMVRYLSKRLGLRPSHRMIMEV